MHGRIKTRTTAEQQEAKRKEREKKIKLYRAGIENVFQKRQGGILDNEILEISAQLLCSNPDIYTVWNIRREVFLYFKTEKTNEEIQQLLEAELHLTEQCLRANPKSYGAWHHRAWVLGTMPTPNWKRELALCNKYLELDERNFHTWNYRRCVVTQAEVPAKDEFIFSTQKISSNFSNYSSWHYRSRLLPSIFPDPHGKRPIREDKHKEELELVQNAAFTDPNDQSAWFYQRWLLGRAHQTLALTHAYVSQCLVFAVLNKSIRLEENSVNGISLKLNIANHAVEGSWLSSGIHADSHCWIFVPAGKFSVDFGCGPIEVHLYEKQQYQDHLILTLEQTESEMWAHRKPRFDAQFSQGITSVLESELDSCLQLLELEPESKWTLLTTVLLMQAIDRYRYQDDTMQKLAQLIKTDPLRAGYYRDLRSRYKMEYILEEQEVCISRSSINLSGQDLTALHHLHYLSLLQHVDLSNNQLIYSLPQLHVLQCCEVLILDNNLLTSFSGMPSLSSLCKLSVKNNRIISKESMQELKNCCNLSSLEITGNPVENEPGFSDYIKQILPTVIL